MIPADSGSVGPTSQEQVVSTSGDNSSAKRKHMLYNMVLIFICMRMYMPHALWSTSYHPVARWVERVASGIRAMTYIPGSWGMLASMFGCSLWFWHLHATGRASLGIESTLLASESAAIVGSSLACYFEWNTPRLKTRWSTVWCLYCSFSRALCVRLECRIALFQSIFVLVIKSRLLCSRPQKSTAHLLRIVLLSVCWTAGWFQQSQHHDMLLY